MAVATYFKIVFAKVSNFVDAKGQARVEINERCPVASASGIYDNGIREPRCEENTCTKGSSVR